MPPSPPGRSRRTAACRRGRRRRRGDDPGRPPARAVPGRGRPAVPIAADDDRRRSTTQGGLAIPAHPLVPYPLCAQGWIAAAACSTTPDPAVLARTRSRPSTRRSLGRPWHQPVVRFADRARSRPGRQQRRPRARGDRAAAGRRSRVGPRTTCAAAIAAGTTRHHGAFHETPASSGRSRDQLRKRGRDARDEVLGRVAQGRHRARPRLPRRPPAATALRGREPDSARAGR